MSSFSGLGQCNLSEQHYSATNDNKSLIIENGSASKVYGWPNNNWTDPFNWCTTPSMEVLKARKTQIKILANAFVHFVQNEFSNVDSEEQLNVMDKIHLKFVEQMNISHFGYSWTNGFKSVAIVNFNKKIKEIVKEINEFYFAEQLVLKNAVALRQNLKDLKIQADTIQTFVENYTQWVHCSSPEEKKDKLQFVVDEIKFISSENLLKVESENDVESIRNITKVISEHLKGSKYYKEGIDRLGNPSIQFQIHNRKSEIKQFKRHCDSTRKSLKLHIAFEQKIRQDIIEIKNDLKDLGVTEENDEKIIKFYVDRLKTKITKKQFENYIDKLKVEEKENEKVCEYLENLKTSAKTKVAAYNWGNYIPPSDKKISKNAREWKTLFDQLLSFFPLNDHQGEEELNRQMLNVEGEKEDGKNKEKEIEPRNLPFARFEGVQDELVNMFGDLMNLAFKLMDAVYSDLKKIGEDKKLTAIQLAELLSQTEGDHPYYFCKAVFFLPKTYQYIANLESLSEKGNNVNLELLPENWSERFHDKTSLMSSWREAYEKKCKKLLNLVGGKENLKKVNSPLQKELVLTKDLGD